MAKATCYLLSSFWALLAMLVYTLSMPLPQAGAELSRVAIPYGMTMTTLEHNAILLCCIAFVFFFLRKAEQESKQPSATTPSKAKSDESPSIEP